MKIKGEQCADKSHRFFLPYIWQGWSSDKMLG